MERIFYKNIYLEKLQNIIHSYSCIKFIACQNSRCLIIYIGILVFQIKIQIAQKSEIVFFIDILLQCKYFFAICVMHVPRVSLRNSHIIQYILQNMLFKKNMLA